MPILLVRAKERLLLKNIPLKSLTLLKVLNTARVLPIGAGLDSITEDTTWMEHANQAGKGQKSAWKTVAAPSGSSTMTCQVFHN